MAAHRRWTTGVRSTIPGDRREPTPDEDIDLVRTLGSDHPVVRAGRAADAVTSLAIETSALLIAVPCLVLVSPKLAFAAAVSAALVAAALWGVAAVLVNSRRRCVDDLILRGGSASLPLVRFEIRRLVDAKRRGRIARALEDALEAGEHWHENLPSSRPPPGVRYLPPNAPLIREIASCLRDGPVSPRAMVMVDRLIEGGYGAALYQGGPEWVRRELGRIRFELVGPANRAQR